MNSGRGGDTARAQRRFLGNREERRQYETGKKQGGKENVEAARRTTRPRQKRTGLVEHEGPVVFDLPPVVHQPVPLRTLPVSGLSHHTTTFFGENGKVRYSLDSRKFTRKLEILIYSLMNGF